MRQIGRADQARVGSHGYVDVPPPETGRDLGGNVFIKVKADGHRSGCSFEAFLAQFRVQLGWMAAVEFFRVRALVPHLLLDLVQVVEIVGERRVNIGQSDGGHVGDDFVGGHALMLMPHYDIEHADTMTGDASLSAADIRPHGDPVLGGRGHNPSIRRRFGTSGA